MHGDCAFLVVQCQKLGDFSTMARPVGILRTAIRTLVSQGMATGYQLWHWCHGAIAKAAAADDEITQPVQQAVANIVFCDRGHDSSPYLNVSCDIWQAP